MITIISVVVVVIMTSLALFLLKKYMTSKEVKWLYAWMACLIVGFIANINLLMKYDISYIYPILKIITVISIVCTGVLFLGETINIYGILGILFGALSIYLLNYGRTHA